MNININFNLHTFSDLNNTTFDPATYSKMKFGCDIAARALGHELAEEFYFMNGDSIKDIPAVVIPAPYNFVPSTAAVLTHHFANRLNALKALNSDTICELSTAHRKTPYISDYEFLEASQRSAIMQNDEFYLNKDFISDKLIIFVDDSYITGIHEVKLKQVLRNKNITNDAIFVTYVKYTGSDPTIEARLNFAGIHDIYEYLELAQAPTTRILTRATKFLIKQPHDNFGNILARLPREKVESLYYACIAKGYHTLPQFQDNFAMLQDTYETL